MLKFTAEKGRHYCDLKTEDFRLDESQIHSFTEE